MPTMYIMCGIPGSGKTTLSRNIPTSMWSPNEDGLLMQVVESDEYRKMLLEEKGLNVVHQNFLPDTVMSEKEKRRFEDKVWEGIKDGIKNAVDINSDIIIDATNTEQWILEEWFDFCNENGLKAKVIVMSTPLNVCIERNNAREQPVPTEVMSRMYNDFIMTIGWLYMEHAEKIINSTHL